MHRIDMNCDRYTEYHTDIISDFENGYFARIKKLYVLGRDGWYWRVDEIVFGYVRPKNELNGSYARTVSFLTVLLDVIIIFTVTFTVNKPRESSSVIRLNFISLSLFLSL